MKLLLRVLHWQLLFSCWAVTAIEADKRSCVTGPHLFPAPSNNNNKDNVVLSQTTLQTRGGASPDRFLVHWKTSIGNNDDNNNNNNNINDTVITVEVIREWSPIGADRFYQLVLDNFYNCATFFRVVPNFIVQFGIAADPEETAKWDVAIADDDTKTSNIQSNVAGTLTYATAGADTRTSQLFVNLHDNAHLDQQGFTPFGRVLTGMGALHRAYNPTPGKSGGIDQEDLMNKGNNWVLQEYPQLDLIWETTLEITFSEESADPAESGENEGKISEGDNENETTGDDNDDEAIEVLNDDDDYNNDKDNDDYEDESFEDENDDASGTAENEKSAFDTSESYNSSGDESGNSFANEKSKMNNDNDNYGDETGDDDEALFGDDNVEEFVETNLKVEQRNRVWLVLAAILELILLLYYMKR